MIRKSASAAAAGVPGLSRGPAAAESQLGPEDVAGDL